MSILDIFKRKNKEKNKETITASDEKPIQPGNDDNIYAEDSDTQKINNEASTNDFNDFNDFNDAPGNDELLQSSESPIYGMDKAESPSPIPVDDGDALEDADEANFGISASIEENSSEAFQMPFTDEQSLINEQSLTKEQPLTDGQSLANEQQLPKEDDKPSKPAKAAKKQSLFSKLKDGLRKTRDSLLGNLFIENGEKIDDDFYDELEEAMIISDMGMTTTEKLLSRLRKELKEKGIHTKTEARQIMIGLLAETMRPDDEFLYDTDKAVIMIVGVNGVGKTTSIGKLASMYKSEGKTVMLAAADTFRAAAAEQLTIWAERACVPIVKHGEGADPAAVVFDSIASYKAKNCDILICDTAGRLHNKVNLMNELSKMRRVIDRELPGVPVEVLLVLDATTGQNAIAQAKVFGENAGLTGIILTKLDGTAKGGVVVAVKDELHLPVRFIGIGEGIDDLQPFDAEAFAQALI